MFRFACPKLIFLNRHLKPANRSTYSLLLNHTQTRNRINTFHHFSTPAASTSVFDRFRKMLGGFLTKLNSPESVFSIPEPKAQNFTVTHLIESYGLAPEAAERIHLKLVNNSEAVRFLDPKAVVKFLKRYGFSDEQIASIVETQFKVLAADVERVLRPEIVLLESLGCTSSQVIDFVMSFCRRGLELKFEPFVDCLRIVLGSDADVVKVMAKFIRKDGFDPGNIVANVAVLREAGVAGSVISEFFRAEGIWQRKSLLVSAPTRFRETIEEVKGMGIDLERNSAVDAIRALNAISLEIWREKSPVFRKWGWSDAELLKAFKERPPLVNVSENKIDEVMDCFVKTVGFKPSFVVKNPVVFKCSKEMMIARLSVVKLLCEKRLIKDLDSFSISTILLAKEHEFLRVYVAKYKGILPELYDLYSKSMNDGKPFCVSSPALEAGA